MSIFFFLLSICAYAQDEYFNLQWYLKNTGQSIQRDINDITSRTIQGLPGLDIAIPFDLERAADVSGTVTVAVIDTGVDIDHPDLKGQILKSNECNRLGQLPPRNAPDLDSNGYSGDCAGWNLTGKDEKGDNQIYDDVGHGTHISGLIAARIDNFGIRGISDKIKILPIKVFSKYEVKGHPNKPKLGIIKRIIRGIEYALAKKVDVINLSMGWPKFLDNKELQALLRRAADENVLIIAAAGNNAQHTTIFPCSYESVVCVGATSVDGSLAPFSNYGGNVDLLAPGERILSTIPRKITPLYFDEDGFDYKNGTSQAAPLIAGSAALLKILLGNIGIFELKARLLNATSGSDPSNKSLYGNFLLSKAYQIRPKSFIYPVIKNLNSIMVDYLTGEFKFTIALEKYLGDFPTKSQISLKLGTLDLVESTLEVEFPEGESRVDLIFRGRVNDLHQSASQLLEIDLQYDGFKYHFNKEITVALSSESVAQKINIRGDVSKIGLRSVEDPFKVATHSLFYSVAQSLEGESLLEFYKQTGNELFSFLTFKRSKDLSLVSVVFYDAETLVIEFFDKANKKLLYEIWPARGGNRPQKILSMVPDSAIWDLNQTNYFKSPFIKGISLSVGSLPASEQLTSVFINPNKSKDAHLYYFEETPGLEIKTFVLDDRGFRKKITQQFNLSFNDEILPVAILGKGVRESFVAIFALGRGYSRKLIEVEFKGKNNFSVLKTSMVNGLATMKQMFFLQESMILTQEKLNAFLTYDPKTQRLKSFEWNDEFDELLGPVAMLDEDRMLAQTQNHFVVLGGSQVPQVPLKRFSFLPGELFSESFAAVTVETSQGPAKGLFIDMTLISENHVSLLYWNGSELKKEIFFQQVLPENCRVMNPQFLKDAFYTILFCTNGKENYLMKRKLSNL